MEPEAKSLAWLRGVGGWRLLGWSLAKDLLFELGSLWTLGGQCNCAGGVGVFAEMVGVSSIGVGDSMGASLLVI